MYAEMLERHMGRIDDLVAGVESLGLKPLDELRRVLEIVCEHFNEHRDFMRIYHLDMTEAFDALVERKRMHHEKTVVLLERAREAGELADVDVELLATILDGAIRELFHHLAEKTDEAPFKDLAPTIFALIIDPLRR